MFLDAYLRVSNAQALTASAISTSVIDLGNSTIRAQIATGEPVGFGLSVGVSADHTTGNETYEIDIVTDEDEAIGSPTIHAQFVRAYSALVAGSLHFLPIPQDSLPLLERYLALSYVLGGMTPTVTVTAWLTTHALFSLTARAYSKGYSV